MDPISNRVVVGTSNVNQLPSWHISSSCAYSGNFKQHLWKHERKFASISTILVAKAKEVGADVQQDDDFDLETTLSDVDVETISMTSAAEPPTFECGECDSESIFGS